MIHLWFILGCTHLRWLLAWHLHMRLDIAWERTMIPWVSGVVLGIATMATTSCTASRILAITRIIACSASVVRGEWDRSCTLSSITRISFASKVIFYKFRCCIFIQVNRNHYQNLMDHCVVMECSKRAKNVTVASVKTVPRPAVTALLKRTNKSVVSWNQRLNVAPAREYAVTKHVSSRIPKQYARPLMNAPNKWIVQVTVTSVLTIWTKPTRRISPYVIMVPEFAKKE